MNICYSYQRKFKNVVCFKGFRIQVLRRTVKKQSLEYTKLYVFWNFEFLRLFLTGWTIRTGSGSAPTISAIPICWISSRDRPQTHWGFISRSRQYDILERLGRRGSWNPAEIKSRNFSTFYSRFRVATARDSVRIIGRYHSKCTKREERDNCTKSDRVSLFW